MPSIHDFTVFLDTLENIQDFKWKDEDGTYWITNEWLCGSFCGRGFTGNTEESCIEQLVYYLNNHIGHDSMVGKIVTDSGWPALNKVSNYLKRHEDEK